jgi:hypothetical protein
MKCKANGCNLRACRVVQPRFYRSAQTPLVMAMTCSYRPTNGRRTIELFLPYTFVYIVKTGEKA